MTRLILGSIELPVDLSEQDLVDEIRAHLIRVVGSRGEVVDWIEQRWGRITLAPSVPAPGRVVLTVTDETGAVVPLTAESLPPGSADEVALGYVVGRLLCRHLLRIDHVRDAPALPNLRLLTELRAVEIASMPQALHVALGELHVIGFTGMPEFPEQTPLWIDGGPVLPTHEPSAAELAAEIEEIAARMVEKYRLSRQGPARFGEPTLRAEVVPWEGESGLAVRLSAATWARGYPDLPLLQWVLVHLMRPRARNIFLPMRSLVLLPRAIPPSTPLASGDHLADLPAVRHQLMPAKIAQILGDLHRRGGEIVKRAPLDPACELVELRFGPIRFTTTRWDRDALLEEAQKGLAPLRELFRTEGGGEAKYGPVTLEVRARDQNRIDFVSREFLPGCPDEILSEFLVGSWLRDGTLPLSAVHYARRIGRRTVVAAPTIQRQLAPGGTVDLIEEIHTGRTGPDRETSGWKKVIG